MATKHWGFVLLIIGALVMLGAFFYPVTVDTSAYAIGFGRPHGMPDRVVNLDKMATRNLIFAAGAVLSIVGAIFTGFGLHAAQQNQAAMRAPVTRTSSAPEYKLHELAGALLVLGAILGGAILYSNRQHAAPASPSTITVEEASNRDAEIAARPTVENYLAAP